VIELAPLAREICSRYSAEYPDESDRYGRAGVEWCIHDNLYLLAWAISDAERGDVDFLVQVKWLAGVLSSREFPLERLARDLQIAAEVLAREHPSLPASVDALQAGVRAVVATSPDVGA